MCYPGLVPKRNVCLTGKKVPAHVQSTQVMAECDPRSGSIMLPVSFVPDNRKIGP